MIKIKPFMMKIFLTCICILVFTKCVNSEKTMIYDSSKLQTKDSISDSFFINVSQLEYVNINGQIEIANSFQDSLVFNLIMNITNCTDISNKELYSQGISYEENYLQYETMVIDDINDKADVFIFSTDLNGKIVSYVYFESSKKETFFTYHNYKVSSDATIIRSLDTTITVSHPSQARVLDSTIILRDKNGKFNFIPPIVKSILYKK